MRRYAWIAVAIAIAVAVIVAGHHRKSSSRSGRPGALHQPAADFTLKVLDGSTLSLANYRGKIVLLDFWATWCTPCRAEIPQFVDYQNKYGARGLQVIGISMDDDAAAVREFYSQLKMNYPVALGTSQMAEAYGGVLGLPVTFIIAQDGRIAAKYVGAADMPTMEREITSLLQ